MALFINFRTWENKENILPSFLEGELKTDLRTLYFQVHVD